MASSRNKNKQKDLSYKIILKAMEDLTHQNIKYKKKVKALRGKNKTLKTENVKLKTELDKVHTDNLALVKEKEKLEKELDQAHADKLSILSRLRVEEEKLQFIQLITTGTFSKRFNALPNNITLPAAPTSDTQPKRTLS